jgi:hypothetical protein
MLRTITLPLTSQILHPDQIEGPERKGDSESAVER